ncbi:MAG TPA: hypothetical protein VHZ25_18090 [Acidobacteriaceae bacterium]|jgi:hypothetical protein|nr:hypothetical protein [Acidobacteriaceae bacterium]
MREIFFYFLIAGLAAIGSGAEARGQTAAHGNDAPLPNATELLQRAIANEAKLSAQQEKYECRVTDEGTETDSKGNVKKTDTEVKEQFYVNGVEVDRTLAKNGKDLTPEQTQKEDERVMKKTVKYSDQTTAKKETDKENRQLQEMMAAMSLANGRREIDGGRSVLNYDIVPNPKFQAKNLNQRFAQVMAGRISIDEETGEPIDVNIRSTQDLKIAGGMLANLHKGFWIHMHDHAQPDGVWLTDLVEGSGDARAALFLHPYFRFRETTGDCHLYSATANQVGPAKAVKP